MGKIKRNWKPVSIDGDVFSGGIEGLVGIEECTDYDPDEILSKKKLKRRLSQPKSDNEPKKKKKKVKNKTNNSKIEEPADFTEEKTKSKTNKSKVEEPADFTEEKASILFAWNIYGLPNSILAAIGDKGFTKPTPIQSLTLPAAVLGRRDILGAAQTGSGKTLAFGLPILAGILKIKESLNKNEEYEKPVVYQTEEGDEKYLSEENGPDTSSLKPLYALILTPTRELAMQIKDHLDAVAKYTGIRIAVLVGGMAVVKQERILSKGPEIVVATPGRLWQLIEQGNEHLSQIDNIKFLAIDETDRMLEKNHFLELDPILEKINFDKEKQKNRQNFVFSATLTLVHDLPKYLKSKNNFSKSKKIVNMTSEQKLKKIINTLGITNPKVVDLSEGKGTSETLTESKITCSIDEKDYYLYYFLKRHPGKTVVFCNSIGCVKRLASLLNLLECRPLPLHASMQQRQRLKNLERFRDNKDSILLATDVAGRGLDIPEIDHVIHYQTPRTSESYVHRSGRTARMSRDGLALVLIEPNELQSYLQLCRAMKRVEDLPTFPIQHDYFAAVKKRIDLTRDIDQLQLRVKKATSESQWYKKAAEAMEMEINDVDIPSKYDDKETAKYKKLLEVRKKQLAALLSTPIYTKDLSDYLLQPGVSENSNNLANTTAVDLVKSVVALNKDKMKKTVPLFKCRKNNKDNLAAESKKVFSKKNLQVKKKKKKNVK